MGKGLAQKIILSAAQVFGGAYPGTKITPAGWMQYLLNNGTPKVISDTIDDKSGYKRDVVVRLMQRSIKGKSITEDNCSVQTRGAYTDVNIGPPMFRALGIVFDDDEIASFERDAAASIMVGKPMTGMVQEMWDILMNQANGLIGDINDDLLGFQVLNYGVNKTTNSNAAKTINFELDGTINNLNSGMTQVMADAYENEMRLQGSAIVGSGLILNYMLQQQAKGLNLNGVDTSKLFIPNLYFDPAAAQKWGENQFGLFEKDAVQFVNINRFRGHRAGTKGGDYFFTLRLPVTDSMGKASFQGFEFDAQMTYRTCPSEVQIGPASEDNPPVRLERGWNLILQATYGQVNIPSNAYQVGDRLYGNNGTYRFVATNESN